MINLQSLICRSIVIIVGVGLASCIEPYEPDVSDYENLLVVDGLLTDQAEDHYIYLSRSYPYSENSGGLPVGNAVVVIADDSGHVSYLEETEPGTYRLEEGALEVRREGSYQLIIELTDGGRYVSAYEVLNSPGSLDSIYYEIKKGQSEETGYAEDGIQLYIDSKGVSSEDGYYQWTYSETWEFTVPYASGNKFRCWKGGESHGINILSSGAFEGEMMHHRKLHFIPFSSNKLYINYSILVKQYGLNGSTFEFYNALETLMEEPRSVFGQIPYSLYGNIENVNDPDEIVLGFFQVSGVKEKRIYIDRSDLPDRIRIASGNEGCIALDAPDYNISLTWYRIIDQYGDIFYTNRLDCTDCTRSGSNVRPAFWESLEERKKMEGKVAAGF